MYNHIKAQQSKNRVHISWDILYIYVCVYGAVNSRQQPKHYLISYVVLIGLEHSENYETSPEAFASPFLFELG